MRSVLFAASLSVLLVPAASGRASAEGTVEIESTQAVKPRPPAAPGHSTAAMPTTSGGAAAPHRHEPGHSGRECRERAAKVKHLWGLARQIYIQRCRGGRHSVTGPTER